MRKRLLKVGHRELEALAWKIGAKTLVVIKGRKGYVMCGYLNMAAAEASGDVAIMVSGVASIGDALRSTAKSVSQEAYNLGIRENQPIRDVLEIIA